MGMVAIHSPGLIAAGEVVSTLHPRDGITDAECERDAGLAREDRNRLRTILDG